MSLDNLRHAQYSATGIQIDDPQAIGAQLEQNPANKTIGAEGSNIFGILQGCGIPRILPSSGTLANNGALTLDTALNITAFPYQCYMYFSGFVGFASFSGTTMTVTGVVSGALVVGSVISGEGIPNGTKVTAFVSGLGGTGTYTINNSVTSGAIAIRASVLGYRVDGSVPDDGMYYVVMTTTTVGTVYANYVDPRTGSQPTIPATPTAFALTAGGAYTQVISTSPNSLIPIASCLIPAGTLGSNGSARMTVLRNWNNNANVKTFAVISGAATLATGGDTTGAGITSNYTLWNQGSQIKNAMIGAGLGDGLGSSAYNQTTLDTSQRAIILFCGRLAAATDWTLVGASRLTVESFT